MNRLNFSWEHYLNVSFALNLIFCRSLSKLVGIGTEVFIYIYWLHYYQITASYIHFGHIFKQQQKSIPSYLISSSSTALVSLNLNAGLCSADVVLEAFILQAYQFFSSHKLCMSLEGFTHLRCWWRTSWCQVSLGVLKGFSL